MKTEMRIARACRKAGSSTSEMSITRPSAGEITSCSPRAPVRSGSRKK
jgi:hypothetical protein